VFLGTSVDVLVNKHEHHVILTFMDLHLFPLQLEVGFLKRRARGALEQFKRTQVSQPCVSVARIFVLSQQTTSIAKMNQLSCACA